MCIKDGLTWTGQRLTVRLDLDEKASSIYPTFPDRSRVHSSARGVPQSKPIVGIIDEVQKRLVHTGVCSVQLSQA